MSNGAQCCALEICCSPAALRTNLAGMVAKAAGVDRSPAHDEVLGQLLDFMEREALTFAPMSFKHVIQDIVTAERLRVAHGKSSRP